MRRVHNVIVAPNRLDLDGTVKAVLVADLRLPIHIALGHYEAATTEELHDHITDLNAELQRREREAARAA